MKTNSRFSRNVYAISDRIWCNKHLRHTTTEKYENNGNGGYFRFDDDNNMSYSYILSITYTEMGQLNTYNPIYCNENKMIYSTSPNICTRFLISCGLLSFVSGRFYQFYRLVFTSILFIKVLGMCRRKLCYWNTTFYYKDTVRNEFDQQSHGTRFWVNKTA